MTVQIVQQRIQQFNPQTDQEKENAYKEVLQEVLLYGLSRSGFFNTAAFQGGTALRIVHGLDRFSEDLDFVLMDPEKHVDFNGISHALKEELGFYGFDLTIQERSSDEGNIKKWWIKDASIGQILQIKGYFEGPNPRNVKIKLEIDTNPPKGSGFESKAQLFPAPYDVVLQDLPSLFASKSHALLCRPYVKGRDWYDFIWYCTYAPKLNVTLLAHAVHQVGPWQGTQPDVTLSWYQEAMKDKILTLDWDQAKQDVARFLKPHQVKGLAFWTPELFLSNLARVTQG